MTPLSQEPAQAAGQVPAPLESPAPVDPVIGAYLEQLDAILLDARTLASGLSPQQFNWRPAGRQWSVGQCLEHLTLTVRLYTPRVELAVAEARDRAARGEKPYREGWFSRWFVRSMEPPPSLRVRTFRPVEPAFSMDRDLTLEHFEAAHLGFLGLLRGMDGPSLLQGRTPSPFLPLLSFTVGQAVAMNLAHARRHLWQARRVVTHPAFPV
jgi:hypothetical protein